MIIEFIAAGIALFLIVSVLKSDTPPQNGVYAQPGLWYHWKRAFFYVFYSLRQWKRKRGEDRQAFRYERQSKGKSGASGYGQKSHAFIPDMDQPQQLADHPDALDCAYFEGADAAGTCFIMRIGRRHGRRCEVWLSVNMPDIGFYQLPIHPATIVYNTDGSSFSGGGLKFECVEPMSRWKITFNGLMSKGLNNEIMEGEKREMCHVKFSFIWDALSEVFDFDTDISASMLSESIAKETWSKEFFQRLRAQHQTHYEQCGELRGIIKIEGNDEVKLMLRSIRDHSYGIRDWTSFYRYIVHFAYLEDGTFFHVSHISIPDNLSNLKCGYLVQPNAEMYPVTWTDLDLSKTGENINPPQQHAFNFTAGGKTYSISVNTEMTPMYYHGENWGNVCYEKICTFQTSDGVKGHGITEFCYRRPGGDCPVPQATSMPMLKEASQESYAQVEKLTLMFTEPAATVARLVGGKGCQLAMLTQMEGRSQSFVVPAGFSLTIAAFHLQLWKRPTLKERVSALEEIASRGKAEDMIRMCEATVAEFIKTELTEEVRQAIDTALHQLFGDDVESKAFAVRSSAAGEDSAELSAAGQMDTILGVRGKKQIHKAVAKCWASHWAHPAVEYRRQHGQPIYSSMGVVIQEMVPAQAAGVLFTRDPITGNPGLMVINANYGLGESVVSGLSEPDNICVQRGWDDEVSIVNKDVGSKKKQITVSYVGTKTIDVASEDTEKCSISNNVILQLARIGIELEHAFSDPRDIEWAVEGNTIYLLQARPITALDQETEWELLHEFDTPLAMDKELLTTANIGEMMPGAMTPLTISVFARAVDWALQDMLYQQDLIQQNHKFIKYLGLICNNGLINMHYCHAMWEKSVIGGNVKMGQLAIMGETLEEITFEDLERYHGTRPLHKRVISGIKNFRNMNNSHGKTAKWGEMLKTFVIGENAKYSKQLYDAIDKELPKYFQCWRYHIIQSAASSAWSAILMSVLSQGKPNWTREMYTDVAMLLSKCDDVYSADVPAALQALAKVIAESGKGEEFAKMHVEDAVRWLSSRGSSGAACHDQYISFLSRHGHRCIREAEFRERSWQSEPAKLISVLQALVPSVAKARKLGNDMAVEDIGEAISKIKSPLTSGGKFAMKYVLPRARKAVGGREWGKSISVQMVEAFKQAYWRLAELMVKECRLPDPDLLFFIPHNEIRTLLEERSGKLIARAQRRRKLLTKQMETRINRVNIGHPVPVEEVDAEDDYVVTSVTLQGLPVSQGVVRGTARVVTSLTEATNIQPGDILIVHYTDVGWSPYFPLINGLVTEIGGLVSHGAVVAREYGLPCIVNVKKATSLFRTGDQVILNGTLGTLEKLDTGSP